MGNIIQLNPNMETYQTEAYRQNFAAQIVQPVWNGKDERPRSRDGEPIKSLEDIARVENYILHEKNYRREEMRQRDHLLFVMGINFGLRAGDLLRLTIGHVLDHNGYIRPEITLIEEKTKETRNRVVRRTLYVNSAVYEALVEYLRGKELDVNAGLFMNMSNNNSEAYLHYVDRLPFPDTYQNGKYKYHRKTALEQGIKVKSAERILKKIIMDEVGLDVHASTHCLRKTFAYHVLMSSKDRTRALEKLQKVLGHSSSAQTLHYIGITKDEIRETYQGLNLCAKKYQEQASKNNFQISSGFGSQAVV